MKKYFNLSHTTDPRLFADACRRDAVKTDYMHLLRYNFARIAHSELPRADKIIRELISDVSALKPTEPRLTAFYGDCYLAADYPEYPHVILYKSVS